jgi:ATP phosphoribosyltransferase regulatory subunit
MPKACVGSGAGGTYRIGGANGGEVATGFSVFPDALIDQISGAEPVEDSVFLPIGHDAEAAARLRAIGWRTVAALSEDDSAKALGCTHVLTAEGPSRCDGSPSQSGWNAV